MTETFEPKDIEEVYKAFGAYFNSVANPLKKYLGMVWQNGADHIQATQNSFANILLLSEIEMKTKNGDLYAFTLDPKILATDHNTLKKLIPIYRDAIFSASDKEAISKAVLLGKSLVEEVHNQKFQTEITGYLEQLLSAHPDTLLMETLLSSENAQLRSLANILTTPDQAQPNPATTKDELHSAVKEFEAFDMSQDNFLATLNLQDATSPIAIDAIAEAFGHLPLLDCPHRHQVYHELAQLLSNCKESSSECTKDISINANVAMLMIDIEDGFSNGTNNCPMLAQETHPHEKL